MAYTSLILHILAAGLLVVCGYYLPHQMAAALAWSDDRVADMANALNTSGYVALILQFAGAGFAVVMAFMVLAAGTMLRRVSKQFFRWGRIVTATLIPLVAHTAKWGLGLWWPALLVPVQSLADFAISQFAPATQVQLGLFHARDHLMTIIIGLAIIIAWFVIRRVIGWFRPPASPPPTPPGGSRRKFKMPSLRKIFGRRGLYLGPISIWLFLVVVLWVFGLLTMLLLWTPRLLLGNATWSDLYILLTLPFGIAVIAMIWIVKLKKFVVRTSKIVALTVLGFRIRAYLKEGDYYIDFENFLIGATQKNIAPFTDKETPDGQLGGGVIVFPLWDSSDLVNGRPNLKIKLNSRGGAGVVLSVTLKGRLIDPQQVLSADDAPLLLGDSGRKALRHSSGRLTDIDIDSIPLLLGALMMGHTIISARLSDTYRQHKDGSLLYDRSGNRCFVVVELGGDIAAGKVQFLRKITGHESSFDPKVLELVKDGGFIRVEEISIDSTLIKTAEEIGFLVTEVLISDVEYSDKVGGAIDQASAEPHEAEAERRTAESSRNVAKIYADTESLYGRDAAIIGAAATGAQGVQTINIPGLQGLIEAFMKGRRP